MAVRNYKTYKNKFLNFVKNGIPVTGIKYDTEVTEVIQNTADFKQCYDPHSKVRKQLPKYWFISKEGFVVNVKGNAPVWVAPNLGSGRPQFKPSSSRWPKKKGITTYDLVALVWGSFISPDAEYLLNTMGAKVIGKNKCDKKKFHINKVQGHHWKTPYIHEKTLEAYIQNNDPANIQLITNKEHYHLGQLAKTEEWKYSFYAPQYANVRAKSPIVYVHGERPYLARISDIKVVAVLGGTMEFYRDDYCTVGDFLFVGKNKRSYIEKRMDYFKNVSQLFEKHRMFVEYIDCGETMWVKYMGK